MCLFNNRAPGKFTYRLANVAQRTARTNDGNSFAEQLKLVAEMRNCCSQTGESGEGGVGGVEVRLHTAKDGCLQ